MDKEVGPKLLNIVRIAAPALYNYAPTHVAIDLSYYSGYDYYAVHVYGIKNTPPPEPLLPRLRVFKTRKVTRREGSN